LPDGLGSALSSAESADTPRVSYRPSGSTEAYFRSDQEAPGPLVVVYHIQKTAGTSLRRVVRANLPLGEVEITPDLRWLRYSPTEALAWYRDWYAGLGEQRRSRLCCVMSHSAGYLLPALDRPAQTLVLVREPVDRILSFYDYKRRNYFKRRPADAPFVSLEEVFAAGADRQRKPPKLESWQQFFNWQSRSLLSVYHDLLELPLSAGPPANADVWRERLRELVEHVFLVGVQDRFGAYVQLLARRFHWEPFVPSSKVNQGAPPAAISADLLETIRACNWLDSELYELCRESQERRELQEQVAT
jgi:hypothetical protein